MLSGIPPPLKKVLKNWEKKQKIKNPKNKNKK